MRCSTRCKPTIRRRLAAAAAALALCAALPATAQRLHAQDAQAPQGYAPRAPLRDDKRIIQKKVWSWQELKRRNVVMQRRDYSCGAAALATLVNFYWGDNLTELQILRELAQMLTPEEQVDRITNGLSLTDLRRVAVQMGYQATIGTLRFRELTESKVPLVVGIDFEGYEHFVVYRGWDGEFVYVADPLQGNWRIPTSEFVRMWQQNAVLVVAKPGEQIKESSPLSVRTSEMYQGVLNFEMVRKQPLQGIIPVPLPAGTR
jgi:predicted double-glycine peptidase